MAGSPSRRSRKSLFASPWRRHRASGIRERRSQDGLFPSPQPGGPALGGVEPLEPRQMLATLYWDPDRSAANNDLTTGAGLGGAGTWAAAGAAVWFNPLLNNGAGGYVSWNNSLGDSAVFAGATGGTVTVSGAVSAAAIEFRTAGFVVTGGGFTTPVGGTTLLATAAGRFDTPISGAGGIAKTGSATLTLGAAVNAYTGATQVSAGLLNVLGTIQSHVQVTGGSVQGVMFYDPDLAAGVREALALDANAFLTTTLLGQSPPLTSLTVDGTVVGDLTGIANLTALTSLELVPSDYAATPQGIASLAALNGLVGLTNLSLQCVGLSDTVLATLPSLPALTRLDVRSNALSAVPKTVADMSRLGTLLVHGNPLLTDNPRAGLAMLKGKAIDVDVAPDRPDIATSIGDLAARLYYLPLKMLEYVTNTVAFQPYVGAMKGPLATLHTKTGNDWDTNSLLAALYGTAGIATRYVAGAVEVTARQLLDYVGTRDVVAAGNILGAAGLAHDGFANHFKHTWLEASVRVPATGAQAWVPIDASWKLRDYRPGLPGVLASVPFSPLEADYLANPAWQKKSTAEYYEAKVATWLARNRPDLTIADVGYDGPIRQQAFASFPAGLPYQVLNQPAEASRPSSIPTTSQYKVNVKLANGSSQLFGTGGVDLSLAEVSLSRLTIDPGLVGAGSSQMARPVLRRDGVAIATAPTPIAAPASSPSMPQLTLTIAVTAPVGGGTYFRTFTRAADRFIAIGLDANQFSESLLVGKRAVVNAQQLNRANGAAVDNERAVGGLLDLAIAQYFSAADADETSLAMLTSAVADRTTVALGIATSAATLSEPTPDTARLQFPYLPADIGIDVPANVNGGFAIEASTTEIDLNRNMLLGYTNSSLEGLVIEELTNCESVSTMKAFQVSVLGAFSVSIPNAIPTMDQALANLVEINAINVGGLDTLLPGVRQAIRAAIASTVKDGLTGVDEYKGVTFKALVPKSEITIGAGADATRQWRGVGYTLTCVTSDPTKAHLNGRTVGFIIHGGVGDTLVAYGGAASRVVAAPPVLQPVVSTFNPGFSAGDPVNMATGGVYHEETDVEIPNLGVPLAFRRRYDSIHTVSGLPGAPASRSDRGMGEGWSFTYSDRVESGADGAGTVTWFTETGMRLVFTSTTSGFANPAGVFGILTGSAATGFTWKDCDGNTTSFGRLVEGVCPVVSKSDRFGNGVRVDYVTGTARIGRVADLRDATRSISFTYNADARPHISSIADFTGRIWNFGYSTDGRLQTATAPVPASGKAAPVVRYGYHPDAARRGLLSSVTDPGGFVTAWEYYANRRGFRVTDTEQLQHSFTYNLFRLRSSFVDERGNASRYSYDNKGNLLELQRADRTTERSSWYATGLTASCTDAYGATTTYAYDDKTGKAILVTDPAGNVTATTYTTGTFRDVDTVTRLGKPADASDDVTTKYTYDGAGFLTSRIDDFGTGRLNATTGYKLLAGGRGLVGSTISARGGVTTFTYNAAGQARSQSAESIPGVTVMQSWNYDARGNLTSRTDGNGNVTSFAFDVLGRQISEVSADPDGAGVLPAISAARDYDASGNLLSTTLGDGRVTRTTYDKRQRPLRLVAADGTYTLVSYDPAGNKASETDALGRITRYVYDARNRLVATVLPDGASTRTRVDGGGRLVAAVDQAGATTTYDYDMLGRKIRETQADPDGTGPQAAPATAWGYDSRGNLQFVTPSFVGQGGVVAGDAIRSTHFEYDALGRKTRETQADPDGSGPLARPITRFSYDLDGNLLTVTDPRGCTTTFGYDQLGRKTAETSSDPDGAGPLGPLVKRYVYDNAGNMRFDVAPGGANEADVSFTTERVFDALNREVRTILPDPDGATGPLSRPTSTRSFNASGFLDSVTDALARSTRYAYDRLGRVVAVANALPATETTVYDAVGNAVTTTDALGRRTFTTFDAMNRPVVVRSPRPDSASATPTATSAYDVAGNPVRSSDALGRATWRQYDALGRLTAETNPLGGAAGDVQATARSEYDSAGRVTATIDELGRRTDIVYDNLGRKIRALGPDAGQGRPITSYGYDAAGNLRFTTDPRGAFAGDPGFTTWFFYDALGRRLAEATGFGMAAESVLVAGQALASPNGRFRLVMQMDGNLAIWRGSTATWSTQTFNRPGSFVTLQADGNLVMWSGANAIWSTGTWGNPNARLVLQDDGNLVLFSATNTLLWQSGTAESDAMIAGSALMADRSIASSSGRYRLLMQTDGNLVIWRGSTATWTSQTFNRPGSLVTLQTDGNLVIWSGSTAIWTSGTYGNPGARLVLQDDGNLVLFSAAQGVLWHSASIDVAALDWSFPSLADATAGTVVTTVTRTAYDALGRVASTADGLGQVTVYAYDNLGRTISESAPAAVAGGSRAVTVYGYDAVGNRTSITDPLGNKTAHAFDALDRRTTVTDARSVSTVTAYDAVGNTVSLTDASSNVTRYAYDRRNRLVKVTDPLGRDITYAYDLVGNKTRGTDRLGRVTSFVYDVADRLVEERWQASQSAAVSHTIARQYDAADRILGVTETDTANPASTTAWQFTYDALGQLVKSRMAPGELVQAPAVAAAPNPPGSLAATDPTIDWDGDGKAERYDSYQITLAVGDQLLLTASSTAFDPALMLQRPGQGLATALVDDHSGGGTSARLLVTADIAGVWSVVVTARDENAIGGYALQIIKDQNAIVPTALVEHDFEYDKAGNVVAAVEDRSAVAQLGTLGPAASGLGTRTSYTVDAVNRVTRYQQIDAGKAVTKRADYAYRADGTVGSVTRFAGAGVNLVGSSYAAYDGMGRLTGITHAPAASPAISYGYEYDAASRIAAMTTPEGRNGIVLDTAGELLSASLTGESYAYDTTGNRTSGGAQTGAGNRLLFDGTYRYAYDAEGNRTAKFRDTNAGGVLSAGDTDVTVYGYDQRNRLVSVSHVDAWTTTQATGVAAFTSQGTALPGSNLELRYTYDYADRRIRRSIDADGVAGTGQESVSFAAYAGSDRTLEIARPNDRIVTDSVTKKAVGFLGQVVQRNFHGNGADEVLAVEGITWSGSASTTATYWTLGDHQDSVRDIVSGNAADRGRVVEHRQYDGFGRMVRQTTGPEAGAAATSGAGVEFGYAGRPFEKSSGLSDNRARWYEPGTGRFINEDPSGFKGGDANLFRYVGNDPLDQVDPSGLTGVWASYGGRSNTLNFGVSAGQPSPATSLTSFTPSTLSLTSTGVTSKGIGIMPVTSGTSSIVTVPGIATLQARNGAGTAGGEPTFAGGFATSFGRNAAGILAGAAVGAGVTVAVPAAVLASPAVVGAGVLGAAYGGYRAGLAAYQGATRREVDAWTGAATGRTITRAEQGAQWGDATAGLLTIGAGAVKAVAGRLGSAVELGNNVVSAAPVSAPAKFDVGPYNQMKGLVPGLDAHHVGQAAAMRKVVAGYDYDTAPTILVPKVGHTIRGPQGIVSRSTKGLETARDILARDINELRRVYQDVPNAKLQEIVEMNKRMYLEMKK